MAFGFGDTVLLTRGSTISTVGGKSGKVIVDEVSRVKDVSIKSLPCPKINDKGLTGAWWWVDKIAIAVALWATAESWKSAKEEYKIGKRYYDLAKEQWDHFYTYYRPLETQELDELWAEGVYSPDYDAAVKGHTAVLDTIYSQADKQRMALSTKYCVCPDIADFRKVAVAKSIISGDGANFAMRYAERLTQEKNDIRWARRVAAASRGRGLLTSSTAFASKASGFFSDYTQAMGGLAGSAMTFSSYVRNRNATQYNPVVNRIDGRAPVPDTFTGRSTYGYWANRGVPETTVPAEAGGVLGNYTNVEGAYMRTGFDPAGVVQAYSTN